jgi:ribonucleoside-triphosphate reductase
MTDFFNDYLAEFVYTRTYARWNEEEGRRENWKETVTRLIDFYGEIAKGNLELREYKELQEAVLKHEVYPSMRLLWSAGDSARRNNISVYNCAYHPCCSIDSFATTMYLLLHGTGVGFSVEKQYVSKLPVISNSKENLEAGTVTVIFQDSKEGWAFGLKEVMEFLWKGYDVEWDLSKIRPKGAVLKVSGGRASGPEPLETALKFIKGILVAHRGRKLSPLNCHDIMCKIAESVVVGGSRRSAMISLSDLDDEGMRHAKDGAFWVNHVERAMSNNSAVYNEKPNSVEFMREWLALAESGSGERGIFNREGADAAIPARRKSNYEFGTNPCAEILLRGLNKEDENDLGGQFCNLTTVIIRPEDTLETLKKKVRLATIMGTIQSAMVNFGRLGEFSGSWQKNTEEERLLGVSLNGQQDAPHLMTAENLKALRKVAKDTNEEYASRLRIPKSAAISCVKPEGTSSIVASCSSGIHPRFAPYYIRRVRISGTDPLYKMMKDQGVKFLPEVGQDPETATIWVCEFPMKSPEGSVCASEMTAIEQLENWLKCKRHWAEHTVSCTVYVKDDEWLAVGQWVYSHWDHVTGISFLPYSDHVYQLAPMEEITESQYIHMLDEMVEIDYSKLGEYEKADMTTGAQNLACTAGQCEI